MQLWHWHEHSSIGFAFTIDIEKEHSLALDLEALAWSRSGATFETQRKKSFFLTRHTLLHELGRLQAAAGIT